MIRNFVRFHAFWNLACNLGVYLDSDMSVKSHVVRLVGMCFGIPRQICSFRRLMPDSTLAMLMSSFIMSKLDYCSVTLAGLPRCDLDRLQSVINAAARLTARARRYDPITALLMDLYWLQMPQRIQYKLYVPVYRCLHGSAPGYLQSSIIPVLDTASCALPLPVTSSLFDNGRPCLRLIRPTCLEQAS